MSAMTDYAEQIKIACDGERQRMTEIDKRIRDGARVRAITGLILSAVILIIAWSVAGVMRQKAVYIVAGIASGLAALLCMQFIPAKLRYVKVDGGYIVYGCIKVLRPCRSIPAMRRSLPVIRRLRGHEQAVLSYRASNGAHNRKEGVCGLSRLARIDFALRQRAIRYRRRVL